MELPQEIHLLTYLPTTQNTLLSSAINNAASCYYTHNK